MYLLTRGKHSVSKEKLVQEGLFQIGYNINMPTTTVVKAKASPNINSLVAPLNFRSPFRGKNPFLTGSDEKKDLDRSVQVYYKKQQGKLFLGDSLVWLKSLQTGSVDLVFADPAV